MDQRPVAGTGLAHQFRIHRHRRGPAHHHEHAELRTPPDFVAETLDDFVMLGLTITAMPAITAIPAVVAAPAGIATYNDLPLLLPRGVLNVSREPIASSNG